MYKFKLSCEGRQAFEIVELPASAPVQRLFDTARDIAGTAVHLRAGFPPKQLSEDAVFLASTLENSGLARQCVVYIVKREQRRFSLHKIPDDNSCLFHAVAYCMQTGITADDLRQVVAATVLGNKQRFTEALLEKAPEEYAQWILHPQHWGGSVELLILCEALDVTIVAIDIESLRISRFPHHRNSNQIMYLLYNGVHYDAFEEGARRLFDWSDTEAEQLVMEIATAKNKAGAFTNVRTSSFTCKLCGQDVTGQQGAQQHAELTGHTKFEQTQQ
ncbi:MAG: hypothetical protein MHM6MM_001997 [Cercozoa sp. M6MM]